MRNSLRHDRLTFAGNMAHVRGQYGSRSRAIWFTFVGKCRLTANHMFIMQKETDEKFMRRCLQLAANGLLTTKPNPTVGAVVVAEDGRIIGEGFTSPVGGPHAEVNAFASVRKEDEALLPGATIYVSLEPCSHWGRTPPCCDLVISKGVKRCVCGCVDPFAKVQGRGIERMRDAGIEVTVGVLEEECKAMNRRFMVFNEHGRPYIVLKWAQTADGFISGKDGLPIRVSTPFTQMLSHKLRAESDAILVGRHTLETDRPRLDVRQWSGKNPEPIVLSRSLRSVPDGFVCLDSIEAVIAHLVEERSQSLIVEGGTLTLKAFLDRGLWDVIRVETSPMVVGEGVEAPRLPSGIVLSHRESFDGNVICWYSRE